MSTKLNKNIEYLPCGLFHFCKTLTSVNFRMNSGPGRTKTSAYMERTALMASIPSPVNVTAPSILGNTVILVSVTTLSIQGNTVILVSVTTTSILGNTVILASFTTLSILMANTVITCIC